MSPPDPSRPRVEGAVTRERMVRAAAQLMQRQGYHGTGLIEIVTLSDTPRGSIYHHFPGGKDEVVQLAIEQAGQKLLDLLEDTRARSSSLQAYYRRIGKGISSWMREGAWEEEGCPVAVLTLETAPRIEHLRVVAERCYEGWIQSVMAALREYGVPARRSRRLADFSVAAIDGAIILCRARNSTEPMKSVTLELTAAAMAARKEPPA